MTDPVRLRVRDHGAYQVEFKIDYELSSARETRYSVNTYIFVPYSLGVSSRTYSNTDFHRDIQNYVRLRTPILSLNALVTDPKSPLVDSEHILGSHKWYRSRRNRERLITNIKLMRPVLNASLRAYLRDALNRRRNVSKSSESAAQLEHDLGAMLTNARAYVDRYRLLEGQLVDQDGADEIRTAYCLGDEALSLVYEDALVWAYRIAEKYLKGNDCVNLIGEEIAQEVEHRKKRKYRSILRADSTNERYLQNVSFLKKYTTSALYLSTSTEREGTTLEQVSFAVAAGLSMIFATIVAFYSQAQYGVLTFPVFIALVVGYMFKDRIKEIGRDLSEKWIRNIRYDQRTTLYTPSGRDKIGYLREKMTFIDHASLPAVVREKREQQGLYVAGLDDQDEEVISYAKEVTVKRTRSGRVTIGESKITGIRDIMRYDIRRYLRKTADPVEQRYMLSDGELVAVDCHKTYSLEFVTEYRSWNEGEPFHYQHSVVYLDRDGITGVRRVR